MMSRALKLQSDHALLPIANESYWGLRLIHYPPAADDATTPAATGAGAVADSDGISCGKKGVG